MGKGWLCTTILLTAIACTNGKPAEPAVVETTPVYYFYPKANVYFDSANKTYAFLGTDGASWQTAKGIPAAMQQLMDKGALIDSPSIPVWRDNEAHKLVYAARLYATEKDTQEVAAPPVVVPQQEPEPVEEKKERKGLRRFFDRIFKGNRKKNEDQ